MGVVECFVFWHLLPHPTVKSFMVTKSCHFLSNWTVPKAPQIMFKLKYLARFFIPLTCAVNGPDRLYAVSEEIM